MNFWGFGKKEVYPSWIARICDQNIYALERRYETFFRNENRLKFSRQNCLKLLANELDFSTLEDYANRFPRFFDSLIKYFEDNCVLGEIIQNHNSDYLSRHIQDSVKNTLILIGISRSLEADILDYEMDHLIYEREDSVLKRFRYSPQVRIESLPFVHPERQRWIWDVLVAEKSFIAQGIMNIHEIIYVSQNVYIDLLLYYKERYIDIDVDRIFFENKNSLNRDIPERAKILAEADQASLKKMFEFIPEIHRIERIAPEMMETLLRVKHNRIASGIYNENEGLYIDLDHFQYHGQDEEGNADFEADFMVNRIRACKLKASGGDIVFDQWSQGFSHEDVNYIETYYAAYSPEDSYNVFNALSSKIYDLAKVELVYQDYKEQSQDSVFFVIDNPRAMIVKVKQTSDRGEIIKQAVNSYKNTIPLDWMSKEEVVILWTTLL